jgi:hypothetical protein
LSLERAETKRGAVVDDLCSLVSFRIQTLGDGFVGYYSLQSSDAFLPIQGGDIRDDGNSFLSMSL